MAFELGRSVRQLREQLGWSQTELARQAGMTQPAVARFEAGGTVPTLPVLERLARALGVELAVTFSPKTAASGEVGDLLRFAATCRRAADDLDLPGDELLDELADAVRCDDMGTEQIFYFPGIRHDPNQ